MSQHTRYGRWNFIRYSGVVLRIMHSLHYLFICIWGVKSNLSQLSKQQSYSNKRKEKKSLPSRNNNLLFSVTALYTTSLAPLSYWTASISIPVPLSANNWLSCLKLSVSSSSVDGRWQWNLRQRSQAAFSWGQQLLSLLCWHCSAAAVNINLDFPVFWNVTECRWVSGFQHFEGSQCLQL